ncbi:BLOC-3 complex member HPS1 [Eupeodes corollae]|uniref:BLOC-3 complex member HPS1 n=1 Tax=Eupeodes corollae TaxID=290404 RepID=UPI002490820E|nr:BLOC-3 complex member HPS1 [Eupeodes corollae]
MNGIIVFNSSNDVVFKKFNSQLAQKIHEIAEKQGLIDAPDTPIDSNIILQIFSPMVSSQRIMFCQFDNTYSSIQCEEDLNFTFGDFLGFSFIKIGQVPIEVMRRNCDVAISLARHLYGPNLFAADKVQEELFDGLVDAYETLSRIDQGMHVEAIPQLMINAEIKNSIKRTLEVTTEKLKDVGSNRSHALLFISSKFVGSYSSRTAQGLSASDILFLSLLGRTLQKTKKTKQLNRTVVVFLEGEHASTVSGCVPCIAHCSELEKGVIVIFVVEYCNLQVASSIFDTFFVLQKILNVQVQGDTDAIKTSFDNLEVFVKQTLDALKKAKLRGDEIESSHKKFASKWENIKKMFSEYFKNYDKEIAVRIESNIPPFLEDLKSLFTCTCCDSSHIALEQIPEVASFVEGKLLEFSEFLSVKAERNLNIESYLEEFPGLVHFIYINRTKGTMIAPDLTKEEKMVPVIPRIWSMVEFTRSYLQKGHTTVMWKDKTFNYSYFLWFEDQNSVAMKPIDLQSHFYNHSAAKPQHAPGLLASDFYHQFTEIGFPKTSPGKIKCYEIFCMHLGLVTTTCAIEHCRRLVATIADVVGEGGGSDIA